MKKALLLFVGFFCFPIFSQAGNELHLKLSKSVDSELCFKSKKNIGNNSKKTVLSPSISPVSVAYFNGKKQVSFDSVIDNVHSDYCGTPDLGPDPADHLNSPVARNRSYSSDFGFYVDESAAPESPVANNQRKRPSTHRSPSIMTKDILGSNAELQWLGRYRSSQNLLTGGYLCCTTPPTGYSSPDTKNE